MEEETMLTSYDEVLNQRYGMPGSPERAQFEEDALNFYSGQILQAARKEAQVTQSELACKTQLSKSYISRIENGKIIPSIGLFYRLVSALGLKITISK